MRAAIRQTLQSKSLPLDRVDAVAVYSVRRLRSQYRGACLQARRASDNATLDIGFRRDNWIDRSAMAAFIGSGTGSVTLYDQSGRGNNAITPTNQEPRMIVSGAEVSSNNFPSIQFEKSRQTYLSANVATGYPVQIHVVADLGASTNGAFVKVGDVTSGVGIGTGQASLPCWDAPGINISGLKEGVSWCPTTTTISGLTALTLTETGSLLSIFKNGVAASVTSATAGAIVPSSAISIGGYVGAADRYATAKISEVIILAANSSTQQSIEQNQISKFGII